MKTESQIVLPGPGEYILREGAALAKRHPMSVFLYGTPETVVEYVRMKLVDGGEDASGSLTGEWPLVLRSQLRDESLLMVNPEHGTLTLMLGPSRPNGRIVVHGSLTMHNYLEEWKINQVHYWDIDPLLKFIRMRKMRFPKNEEYEQLVRQLTEFKSSAKIDMAKTDNRRGEKSASVSVKADLDIAESFDLAMPLFRGMEDSPARFTVNLFYDYNDARIRLYFESVDLTMLLDQWREEAIKGAVAEIKNLAPGIPRLVVDQYSIGNGTE